MGLRGFGALQISKLPKIFIFCSIIFESKEVFCNLLRAAYRLTTLEISLFDYLIAI